MKRIGYLLEQIVAFENLLKAAKKALKGKRQRKDAQKFWFCLEQEIFLLQESLQNGAYEMQPYSVFTIYDPKKREIAAPKFIDNVAAHAIDRVINPLLDQRFIYDSYASRIDKGTAKAVYRAQYFATRWHSFLKLDIKNYFASIDHEILLEIISEFFKDQKLIAILQTIIKTPVVYFPKGKGLALGHLLSQIFANLYLNKLDFFIKKELRVKGYVRYMDDMVLFSHENKSLYQYKKAICEHLQDFLKLEINMRSSFFGKSEKGLPFLGFLIFPGYIRLRNKTLQKGRKTLKNIEDMYHAGILDEAQLQVSVSGFIEHLKIANSLGLRQKWLAGRSL